MDINISANTLFHFTTSKRALLSILENGLYVRYSLENYESLISGKAELVFPMVCFCDIPLSQVKRHTGTYGQYAIGLTKDWGMKNKINPVIYTYPNSTTANILNELVAELDQFFNIKEDEKPNFQKSEKNQDLVRLTKESLPGIGSSTWHKVRDLQDKLGHFLKYIKPYEGAFYRDDKEMRCSVRFYEEREWRFTLPKGFFSWIDKGWDIKDSFKAEYYKNPVKRRAINIKLAKHIKLEFEPSDIRFIIVNKESEIPAMFDKIEQIFQDRATMREVKLLGTRLISLEQILEDL